jgi:hypothetical protein
MKTNEQTNQTVLDQILDKADELSQAETPTQYDRLSQAITQARSLGRDLAPVEVDADFIVLAIAQALSRPTGGPTFSGRCAPRGESGRRDGPGPLVRRPVPGPVPGPGDLGRATIRTRPGGSPDRRGPDPGPGPGPGRSETAPI